MFTASIITILAIVFFLMKFSPNIMKRIIGMDKLSDIGFTLLLLFMFGATATISGMMTGLLTGLIISVVLIIAKGLLPHQKLEKKHGQWRWTNEPGRWFKKKEPEQQPKWWEV